MGATKARVGLSSLGMLLLGSLLVVDAVWAQGGMFFISRDFMVGELPLSITVGDFNGDGQQDLATGNYSGTVLILINTPGVVVNDLVTFDPIQSTFTSTPDLTGCPEGIVGKFSFEARLTNTSDSSLTDRS